MDIHIDAPVVAAAHPSLLGARLPGLIAHSRVPGWHFIHIHDDELEHITFGDGLTAVDRGDEIDLYGPDGQRMIIGPQSEIIIRKPGEPTRRIPQLPIIRQALDDQGIPTPRL